MNKSLLLFVFLASITVNAKKINTKKINSQALEKVPKSIFLLKKAELNINVNEPKIHLPEKQLESVLTDDRLFN
ncbi:MAG: hypothetical protein AB8E15_11010 [Bdellovibrionales bacterium]